MRFLQSIRCTAPNCTCEGFTPSKPNIRSCNSCHHGWVAHDLVTCTNGYKNIRTRKRTPNHQAGTLGGLPSRQQVGTSLPAINLDRVFPTKFF
ncbi:hypothetical protein CDAR_12031 [Caerostris darwini]|uniref:Uncharacterized protein n=1 Tax=Caerostris darwini TaxID=1538125 RepID=A0AAV4M3H5_9ARAC|nr:hypothetical protein CDAR_12031 [Caerostris darwini]